MYLEKKGRGNCKFCIVLFIKRRLIDLVIDWLNVKWKVLEMRPFYDLK